MKRRSKRICVSVAHARLMNYDCDTALTQFAAQGTETVTVWVGRDLKGLRIVCRDEGGKLRFEVWEQWKPEGYGARSELIASATEGNREAQSAGDA